MNSKIINHVVEYFCKAFTQFDFTGDCVGKACMGCKQTVCVIIALD